MNGDTYIEGALIDTVSFERLLYNHPDLDEVWVSRILDRKQIRPANNLSALSQKTQNLRRLGKAS